MNCIIRRSPHGHLCGYVAVEAGHPFYGFEADALPRDPGLKVHGRISYARACQHSHRIATSIWRMPPTADSTSAWWFGFECNHSFDLVPLMSARGGARDAQSTRAFLEDLGNSSCENRGCGCPPSALNWTRGLRAGAGRGLVYRGEAYVYRECVNLAAQLDAVGQGLPMPDLPSSASGSELRKIGGGR